MNNIKKLVAFGCSWTFGDELDDPELAHEKENPRYWDMNTQYRLDHCYAGLIAKHYGWEFENLAFPGHSLVSMRDVAAWYVKNHDLTDTIFIVGLTESWRWSWHNNKHYSGPGDPDWNRHVNSSWILHGMGNYAKSWQDTFRSFMEDQLCEELQVKNKDEALMLFDGIAARYNIPVVQANMLEYLSGVVNVPTHAFPEETAQNWIVETGMRPRDVFAPGRHPNEKGHEIISKKLIDYIDANVL